MARASPAAEAATGLRLYFLGRLRIERDTRPIHLPRRKVESLLAYLVLRPEAHAREQLAALFWGGSPDAQARHSLRTALGALRKGLGAEFLLADREAVQLNPAYPAWVDALEFQTQAAQLLADPSPEAIAVNVELYRGDLLSDFYDDWIQPEREHYRALYLDTLLRLAGQMRSRGKYERAVEFAGRAVAADRANERAHQHLMFCYAAIGDRSAAARQYEECQRALLEDLGVEPAPETAAIYQSLKQAPSGVTSTESPRTNLPHSLTSFIGRRREMTEVKALLSETRLFTITGAGGSGKTRLAIQVATELADGFEDGAWLVELAGLTDPALVLQTLAAELGVRETPYQSLGESLVSALRSKRMLIVLDNCEHVIHACAQLSDLVLSGCPSLQILATSREALGITGEVAWQVPTLSLPDPRQALPIQALLQFEAIRLFAERAQAVNQGFTLTEQNAPAVQEVCHRLDGIPLAIELAAARVKMLSVEQIAGRLDDRFNLLTTGSRTALPRHQTLRAMIDWSHDLLSEKERAMFRRLSVFAGGFALTAATAVCAGDGIEENEALDLLSHLVDKSLVIMEADQRSGQPRYRLLDTIRQYSMDRLREADEAARVQSRHAQYFLSLAEEAEPWLMTRDRGLWMDRLESEHDNLRAALEWSQAEAGSAETMLRLAGALIWFWIHGGYPSEGRRWLTGALARKAVNGITARAKALCGAGFLARTQGEMAAAAALLAESVTLWRASGTAGKTGLAHALVVQGEVARDQGDPAAARSLANEAVALFREQGDRWGLAYSLTFLGMAIRDQEDFTLARSRVEESMGLWRDLGDQWGLGTALSKLGEVALRRGDYETARSRFGEALAARKATGDKQGIAESLHNLGMVMLNLGDEARARPFFEESMSRHREIGNRRGVALTLVYFGVLALYDGDEALAQSYFTQALDLAREVGPTWYLSDCLMGAAGLAAVRGQARRGARLWGAAEARRIAGASYMDKAARTFHERTIAAAQAQLGEAAFDAAHAEGMAMPIDDAIEYGLGTDDTD